MTIKNYTNFDTVSDRLTSTVNRKFKERIAEARPSDTYAMLEAIRQWKLATKHVRTVDAYLRDELKRRETPNRAAAVKGKNKGTKPKPVSVGYAVRQHPNPARGW